MSLRIHGNRALKTLPGNQTRPTGARVRAAVFNIWQGYIEGASWLDICAGAGAMGAEALCRDAKQVIGIEQSSRACAIIQENWQKVARPHQEFQIIRGDVVQILPQLGGQQFERIYFDPPYKSNLYPIVLNAIATYKLLAPDGEIAVEHPGKGWEAPAIAGWEICRQKTYGSTGLTFYRYQT
ncbi:16S rRNA (guanine(966)-N(2))-methyltransferase RsmD [Calothrix sp. NIES-3974]|uniref:16S rRNA (guanine(966)-N(2))-methyltransferase RsmD n=1 Tax=Calothrix sp. NIES-3974 TaxID=2005462 RepID=UPI000B610277|nr:16S rRNA (guanine(966)-N(2))-methyltransferase RsmD [Calothrix sp. NIES-3974]BAZ06020.1 putative methyltransferase [Calothrix sp. NIES-3974]